MAKVFNLSFFQNHSYFFISHFYSEIKKILTGFILLAELYLISQKSFIRNGSLKCFSKNLRRAVVIINTK